MHRGSGEAAPVVAIFNSSDDTIEMLRIQFESVGMHVVSAHVPDIKRGEVDVPDFVAKHRPDVVIYDIAPPYEQNWTFFKLVRSSEAARDIPFVITTTNRQLLEKVCDGCEAYEIVGKPYDLEVVVRAARHALKDPS